MLHNNLDVLLISEIKIDSAFPTVQFQIEGYTTYRLCRNANGGSTFPYIGEDLLSISYSPSYNLTPPISLVLIGQHLIFCSLTSPTYCNSP